MSSAIYQFGESELDLSYYLPLDFNREFRTYFKFYLNIAKLWPVLDVNRVPSSERYRLGGYSNLRGFGFQEIGPKKKRGLSPLGSLFDYNIGGDKKLHGSLEYFVPIIPDAGIKAVLFADFGQVFLEEEPYSINHLKKDIGFGFRWLTPIAPFRFEWAYPSDDETKTWGDMHFIFNIGY